MKKNLNCIAAIILCLSGASTLAEVGSPTPQANPTQEIKKVESTLITCTKGNDVRTLKVERIPPTGCKGTYTVKGPDKVIANALNEFGLCKTKVDKIAANLTAAGFKCE